MRYIISYDISDQKALKKTAKKLEDFAYRIQKSVFMEDFSDAEFKKLQQEITPLIDRKSDSLIFLPVCQSCFEKMRHLGIVDINMQQGECMIL